MQLLCADELGLLDEAADHPGGLIEAQVAGPGAMDQFGRLVSATSLELAGYLEPLADAGPFARWRIKPAILDQVREVLAGEGITAARGRARPARPGPPSAGPRRSP